MVNLHNFSITSFLNLPNEIKIVVMQIVRGMHSHVCKGMRTSLSN